MRTDIPRIKQLVVVQTVTMILALAALGIAVVGLDAKASAIQTSRRDARQDTCYLLRGLVHAAAEPGRRAAVAAYEARTPLVNCNHYAQELK